MVETPLRTAVALILFNRPETTARVFESIAAARPPILLAVADGPRANRPGEAARCAAARAVLDRVDWPCEVRTNFADANLGCRRRVSSGIDWVFEQVPEAIILEDDCLPHPSFFPYCEELLERYRDEPRIGMIGGTNYQLGRRAGSASYYYSKYAHIWGWAGWRRAWRHYDVAVRDWPAFCAAGGLERIALPCEREYWYQVLDRVHEGTLDTWDYQWTFACWQHAMLSVIPEVNLISNIGFGPDASRTHGASPYNAMPTAAIAWPLEAPPAMTPDAAADERTARAKYSLTLARRLRYRVHRWRREARGRAAPVAPV